MVENATPGPVLATGAGRSRDAAPPSGPNGAIAPAPAPVASAVEVPVIRVELVHGELENADHPVLVAHATGTPISGAEARCDQLLGGQLSRLQLLGLYPDRPGEIRLVAKRLPQHRLPGCILLGLDSSQPLTQGALAELVSRAVLASVEKQVEPIAGGPNRRADDPVPEIGISAVTMGTGPVFGMGVERSVVAVVDGVQRANNVLASAGLPTVRRLQFVERYAAKVEWALWALEHRSAAAGGRDGLSPIVLDPEVRTAAGARPGLPSPRYDSGTWERLSVEVVGEPAPEDRDIWLRYRFARDRAVVSEQPRRLDRQILAEMLRDVANHPERSAEIGVVLFEELLPVELKEELGRIESLVLQVDERTADIPWELVIDRMGGTDPLSCRAGLLRQFRDSDARPPSARNLPAPALVIGDPPTQHLRLPEAGREAREIAEMLRAAEIDVEHVDFDRPVAGGESSAHRIRRALWSRDYRLVHIAAHGLHQVSGPAGIGSGEPRAGIAIGDGAVLTADDFRNLRVPPELVFLNCCHLGRMGDDEAGAPRPFEAADQRTAAVSLARELIRIGVKAVLVAGWQVDDLLASRFALRVYDRLVDGVLLGEAVKQARAAAYRSGEPADTTWAAYQCYGDPGFRLRLDAGSNRRDVEDFPLRAAAVRRLEEFLLEAEKAEDPESLLEQLERIDEKVEQRWPDDGELLAMRGRALGDLGRLGEAAKCYERAVSAGDGSAPIRSIEQLVNLHARHAIDLLSRPPGGSAAAADVQAAVDLALREAERWGSVLEMLTSTSEREGVDGGLRKRLAVVRRVRQHRHTAESPTADWRVQVNGAIVSYASAAITSQGNLWGFRNALQLASVTVSWPDDLRPLLGPEWGRRWAVDLARDPGKGDFWDRVAKGDSLLTAALVPVDMADTFCPPEHRQEWGEQLATLIGTGLPALVDRIAECYLGARTGGYTGLYWRSLVAHLWELGQLADEPMSNDLIALWRLLAAPGAG